MELRCVCSYCSTGTNHTLSSHWQYEWNCVVSVHIVVLELTIHWAHTKARNTLLTSLSRIDPVLTSLESNMFNLHWACAFIFDYYLWTTRSHRRSIERHILVGSSWWYKMHECDVCTISQLYHCCLIDFVKLFRKIIGIYTVEIAVRDYSMGSF